MENAARSRRYKAGELAIQAAETVHAVAPWPYADAAILQSRAKRSLRGANGSLSEDGRSVVVAAQAADMGSRTIPSRLALRVLRGYLLRGSV